MLNAYSLLALLVTLSCAFGAKVDEYQVARLKSIFPHLNVTALYEAPQELFESGKVVEAPQLDLGACPPLATPADTNNVNNLRPGNIRVVMAMGDSITAAMSAKDKSLLSLKEYRGIAYSIGGDAGVTTFPNLLKPYVPVGFPIGFSTGIGERSISGNGLNAAESGGINSDMPGQAQWLVQQLKANKNIDMLNDWKVLTIWIGSNNLCDVCDNQNENDAANFQSEVTEALEYLYNNVPRLFVNLVANLEITTLAEIDGGACSVIHWIVCGCVTGSGEPVVETVGRDYQSTAYAIASQFNSRNSSDFAVVVQPFLVDTNITERSQLSAADCFHPSAPSHATAAVALWNNMLSPAAQKSSTWNVGGSPICPTTDTLLYTH